MSRMLLLLKPGVALAVLLLGWHASIAADGPAGSAESAEQRFARLPPNEYPLKDMAPFWAKRETGYFATRDGEELHYSVLLPRGKGPFPTLLVYSGYSPGSLGGAAYLQGKVNYPRGIEQQLLESGYAIIGVNARATGCSSGQSFDWLRPTYGEDGYDAVEFAARQPWSNGAVGMYSWSWAGMSQLWTASFRPPHLRAVAPGHVIADPREDSYAPGGVPQPTMISGWGAWYLPLQWKFAWDTAQAEHDSKCLHNIEQNLKLLDEGSPGKLVLQHPLKDDYQEVRTVARRTHLINVPVLSLTSFQDWSTTSRGGYYQHTLDPTLLWMIDTNGNHGMYSSLEYRKTMIRFFDHFVKGRKNGFEATPRLQIWEEAGGNAGTQPGADGSSDPDAKERASQPNFVINRDTIDPAVETVSFALTQGGGLLEKGIPSGEADSLKYPIVGPAIGEEGWGPLPAGWKEGALAFTTPPLERDLIAYGPASADLWVSSSDTPDADLQVTVTAVLPDGQEIYVQRGWLRLSNRAFDAAKSTPGRPVRTNLAHEFSPVGPGQTVLARVEVNRLSYPFRKGTRLRMWIDTPGVTGDYTFSYNPVPTTLKVWHDRVHPSQLVMNVLEGEAAPKPARPCGQVIAQPCRPDPLH